MGEKNYNVANYSAKDTNNTVLKLFKSTSNSDGTSWFQLVTNDIVETGLDNYIVALWGDSLADYRSGFAESSSCVQYFDRLGDDKYSIFFFPAAILKDKITMLFWILDRAFAVVKQVSNIYTHTEFS